MDTRRGARAWIARPPSAGVDDGRRFAYAPGRVALYFGTRYLTPLIVLVTLSTRPDVLTDRRRLAALLTAQVAYAFVCHFLASRRPATLRSLIWIGLFADVITLSAIVHLTGGPPGPLTFLFALQALAAGILFSASLGIRVLFLSTVAIVILDVLQPAAVAQSRGLESIAALWVVGGVATLLSAFNERELRRRNAELQVVRQVALDIQNTLSLDEILEHLARGVTEGLHFDGAAALIRTDGSIGCVAASGITGAVGHTLDLRGPLERALATGRPVVVSRDEARRDGALYEILGARGYVAVPLDGHGLLVATRNGRKGRQARLRAHEIESLARLAAHATVAIANARLHEHVSTLAVTDPLTGLANHGEFQRRLAVEAGRLQRYAPLRAPGHRLSLLLVDIDNFKQFNDRFGHQAGDEVLRSVAAALRASVRSFDIVARYGGEEFVAILPETGAEGALGVAERIREAVAAKPFLDGGSPPSSVTVSIGVSVSPDHGKAPANLISAADAALYRSKGAGRNRVTLADPDDGPLGSVVELRRVTPRPRAAGEGPAPAGARRARGRSSLPRSRTPRG